VQPFCTVVRMIQRFGGHLKVGTVFALINLRQQRHQKQCYVVRYHDDNDQSGRV
jgi:hypothetical protein